MDHINDWLGGVKKLIFIVLFANLNWNNARAVQSIWGEVILFFKNIVNIEKYWSLVFLFALND